MYYQFKIECFFGGFRLLVVFKISNVLYMWEWFVVINGFYVYIKYLGWW